MKNIRESTLRFQQIGGTINRVSKILGRRILSTRLQEGHCGSMDGLFCSG
jgi:hypothetical protein